MDKAYRLGDEQFMSIWMNIKELMDVTNYLNHNLSDCQSITEFRKFKSTAEIDIPKAKECIVKNVEDDL